MNKLMTAAMIAAVACGCVSVDKFHEGPADAQEGLSDHSYNPYAISYDIEKERKTGTGHSECWCWFFASNDGRHMSPPGITIDSGLKSAKESATYDVVEKAKADALVGALYKYTQTSKWLGFYKSTDVEVIGFPAHVKSVTQTLDRPVLIGKDQQVIRVKIGEKIENQTVVK